MTVRIGMWSGPRNISTAMMRSWENRNDTVVVDEPFYACYLARSKSPHPYFEEIMAVQSSDYQTVAKRLTEQPVDAPMQYQKLMTHHMLEDIDLSWTVNLRHCFLIRDPAQVVNSYTNSRGECTVDDIGIVRQTELYQHISELSGQDIPIVDAADVLSNPQVMLELMCQHLGVTFSEKMLRWPKGYRDSDGVWASHWYHSVSQSTGFAPYQAPALSLSPAQQQVVDMVQPHYNWMYQRRLRP